MSAKKIFVVEDSIDIQIPLRQIFESEGYTVEFANNGQEALEKLRTTMELPALILLDIMMPVMDGFQFREHQKADVRIGDIPVVIMSADANVKIKQDTIGAKHYLRKPINIDTLLEVVRKYAI